MKDPCDTWLDAFFAAFYARRPVSATFVGVHAHDASLPDYSEDAVADTCREMERLLASAPSPVGLSPIQRLDLQLALDALETQLAEFRLGWLHRQNPAVYTGEAVFGVIALFLREFAPIADRAQSAIARMTAIPAFLAQGKANLATAPRAWTDKAIRECAGARHFLTAGLERILFDNADALGGLEKPLRDAAAHALIAFDAFEKFLREELALRDNPNYACGAEFFNLLVRKGHHTDLDGNGLIAYGTRRLCELQARLDQETRAIRPDGDWRAILAGLGGAHPSAENYLARFQQVWDACKASSDAHELVTWPDYPLKYVEVGEAYRSCAPHLYFLPYRAPSPFDQGPTHQYLVPPLSGLSAQEQESRLRATNDSVIILNHVVHHGAIGHHVQNWNAYRGPSRVGRMAAVDCALRIALFSGGTMAEGWACYVTDLMDEMGFYSPEVRIAQIQSQARQAARCVADASLHLGAFSLDEAADYYAREAGMSADAGRAEAVKNSMFPGAAVMYLLGTDGIHALRRTLAKRQGAAFNLRAFHDAFLSHGSVPVPLIARMMTGEAP